jgi:HEAT repeat protein
LRAAAIAALGLAGDARVLDAAREAAKDKEPRVRVAGADALVHLAAPDAGKAIEALVGDEVTARDGLRLAGGVEDEGVTKALAARAAASADPELRALAVAALGRQTSPSAVTTLASLAADPRLAGDAAQALARSPSPAAAGAIEAMAASAAPGARRLAARAYFVRRMARGARTSRGDALLAALAASADGADRAVGVEALVVLGERPLAKALEDTDPRVRRAAAMAGGVAATAAERLLARLGTETDEPTRVVLAAGLAGGDPGGRVPTAVLVERAQAGGGDAPLAALALAQRADDELAPRVDALLASHDPWMRAHVARGLAASAARDVTGRLGGAFAWEPVPEVRRALVEALAARTGEDADAPSRRQALELAAWLEPDAVTREEARRALDGARPPARPAGHEVAWLRVVAAEGATRPKDLTGAVVGEDGVARPVVFDDDGYALVPGMPPGDAQLRLDARPPPFTGR